MVVALSSRSLLFEHHSETRVLNRETYEYEQFTVLLDPITNAFDFSAQNGIMMIIDGKEER